VGRRNQSRKEEKQRAAMWFLLPELPDLPTLRLCFIVWGSGVVFTQDSWPVRDCWIGILKMGTMKKVMSATVLGIAVVAGFGGCDTGEKRLSGAGATFVDPMMSKWAREYERAKDVRINYNAIGSGGGIKQMTAQTVAFGCSDSPMNQEQLKNADDANGVVVHIPLVMGAVVPAYNLPEAKEPLKFTGPVLADIYLGKIKKWNDDAIAKLNPDAKLPDKDILVVHRSDASGTTFIWVDYLSKLRSEWKEKVGVSTSVKWPTGTGQSGNPNVAGFVKRNTGTIGYVELIYALQNDIAFGLVQNKEGVFVKASLESVTAAAAASQADIPDDLRFSIANAAGKDSYPISGASWAIAFTNNPGGKGKEVRDFFYWCTHDGQSFCEKLHYSKLPQSLVERVEKRLELIK
jgi:phosphate ABC transporter phosphate-binding protein